MHAYFPHEIFLSIVIMGNPRTVSLFTDLTCFKMLLITSITSSLIINLLIVHQTFCDHLRQSTDSDLESSDAEPATGDKNHQLADPEYIKRELKDLMVTKIDSDKDGQVSYEELKNYLIQLHEKNIEYNVDKQWLVYSPQIHEVFSWEGYEPERKEVLTWDHYFNQTYPELIGVDIGVPINREQDTSRILASTEQPGGPYIKIKDTEKDDEKTDDPQMRVLKQMVRRADARWKLADENGDTLLTKSEFKFLLHPDEGDEELRNLFVKEATEDMDLNQDGKICLDEFMKHLQELASDQERNDQSWLSIQQENFGRFLDKNKDGVLDGDEIKDWLVPPRNKKYETEAKRLMEIGDQNEDHRLSRAELLEHYEQYLSLLPPEYWRTPQENYEEGVSRMAMMNNDANHDEL